jgi:hypothetical protein
MEHKGKCVKWAAVSVHVNQTSMDSTATSVPTDITTSHHANPVTVMELVHWDVIVMCALANVAVGQTMVAATVASVPPASTTTRPASHVIVTPMVVLLMSATKKAVSVSARRTLVVHAVIVALSASTDIPCAYLADVAKSVDKSTTATTQANALVNTTSWARRATSVPPAFIVTQNAYHVTVMLTVHTACHVTN